MTSPKTIAEMFASVGLKPGATRNFKPKVLPEASQRGGLR